MAMPELACIAAQCMEHTRAVAMLSDLEHAFQLQMEEAMAASKGLDHDAWRASGSSGLVGFLQQRSGRGKGEKEEEMVVRDGEDDARLAVQMQSRELERCEQELVDQLKVEEETRAVAQRLQQRAHDLEFAKMIEEVPEEEWEEIGDTIEQPFEAGGEGEGGSSGLDCDQAFEIEIQGVKTQDGHVGIGCMLTDPAGKVVWQQSKYLGAGLSWHLGEYTGLLEAMAVAERLGLHRLVVRVSSRLVGNQVNGFWKPKLSNQRRLMTQVQEAMCNFSSFELLSGSKAASSIVVNQLAQAAISSHLAGDASMSNAEPSTSGTTRKGLQQNMSIGASTSAGPSNRIRAILENCLICLEDKSSSEMAMVKDCMHKFCVACMKQHAAVQVQASQVPVRCPQAGCPKTLEIEECRQYLTDELFNSLSKRLIEASVPEGDRVYCPFANCSALMDKSGLVLPPEASSSAGSKASANRKVQCVDCRRSFCVDCRVPWHWNRSCEEYQNLPPEVRDAEDSNLYKLAQNEKWQRCKKCRRMIELAEGCYHMTCRCGHEFCYTCGAEYKNKKQSCSCKLWDERNIVDMPFDSDDESEDDEDDDFDEYMDEEDEEDYSDYEDEELESYDGGLVNRNTVHELYRLQGLFMEPYRVPPPNHFYKTKMCRYYLRSGGCTAGNRCNFAHGKHELRHI